MQSKNYHNLFIKILKDSNKTILTREELINIIGSKEKVVDLVKEGYILEEKNNPTQCPCDGCESREITYEIKNDKILITDLLNLSHQTEQHIDKWITCEIDTSKIIQYLLNSIFGDIKCVTTTTVEDLYKYQMLYNGNELDVILSISTQIYEDELFTALSPSFIFKRPVLIITKDTISNFQTITSICIKIPLGNLVYPFYIDDFKNKNSGNYLKEWIEGILEIKKLEDEVLKDLPEKRSKLVYNIDINPKYLLSFFVRLKAYKIKMGEPRYDWKEMEDAISVAFRYLYHSDIRYGGGQQPGKEIPDNIFFIKDRITDKFVITGIVDAKFSIVTDLNAEKTEKYEEYLNLARGNPFAPNRIALIFPVLDVKSIPSIKKFFDRLKKKMKTDEFCIVLPITTLEILVYLYLSAILRGKLDLTENDFIKIKEKIFSTDFLEEKCKLDTDLYKLDAKVIINLIKDITKKTALVEELTSRIMDK